MKTAVIYARYSCDNQTEQSIEGQLRVCHDYAERNGILIVETYIDRAMTGTNDMRPDFQRMMKDSGKRKWNYVLVYKLDRFSRNKYEATVHKNTLKNNGVKVPENVIREYYAEALKLESVMLINLFIRKIVLYNDKIEIYFNTPLRNGPDDDRGCSFFVGVGYLPRVSLHKDELETDIIKIEMLAG